MPLLDIAGWNALKHYAVTAARCWKSLLPKFLCKHGKSRAERAGSTTPLQQLWSKAVQSSGARTESNNRLLSKASIPLTITYGVSHIEALLQDPIARTLLFGEGHAESLLQDPIARILLFGEGSLVGRFPVGSACGSTCYDNEKVSTLDPESRALSPQSYES